MPVIISSWKEEEKNAAEAPTQIADNAEAFVPGPVIEEMFACIEFE